MKVKRLLIIAALLLLLAGLGRIFIFPPFALETITSDELTISYYTTEYETENFALLPIGSVETKEVLSGDYEYQRITQSLESLNFTHCFHTISSEWFPEKSYGDYIGIFSDNMNIFIAEDSSHAIVDDVVVRGNSVSNLYQICLEIK